MLVIVNKSHDKTKNNSRSFSFWLNVQICKKTNKKNTFSLTNAYNSHSF